MMWNVLRTAACAAAATRKRNATWRRDGGNALEGGSGKTMTKTVAHQLIEAHRVDGKNHGPGGPDRDRRGARSAAPRQRRHQRQECDPRIRLPCRARLEPPLIGSGSGRGSHQRGAPSIGGPGLRRRPPVGGTFGGGTENGTPDRYRA
jgi:hypothetical protein